MLFSTQSATSITNVLNSFDDRLKVENELAQMKKLSEENAEAASLKCKSKGN